MLRWKPKQLSFLGVLLTSLVVTSLAAAQKRAVAQAPEQQDLKERVDALESQLIEAQDKADHALMEKDYIERTQKEVNAYYEKAFNTQIIVVTITGIIIGLAGKFGIDHIVSGKLTEASTKLRDNFTKQLSGELKKTNDSSAGQMEQLADDILLMSRSTFYFLQGLTFSLVERHAEALVNFGKALSAYKLGKSRHLQPKEAGAQTLANVLEAIKNIAPGQFKELADQLYNGFGRRACHRRATRPRLRAPYPRQKDAPPSTPQAWPLVAVRPSPRIVWRRPLRRVTALPQLFSFSRVR